MLPSPFRHLAYGQAADVPNVVVDGSPTPATTLVLSHWPGMPTPPDCAADTSAQMVFRYLDRGADLHGAARVATNNHFDQDGLCGLFALVDPEMAWRHRTLVEAVAVAGDFAVARDRRAARLSMAVDALADPDRTPLDGLDDADDPTGLLYDEALARLGGWLEDPDRCRDLWADEDARLGEGLDAITRGAVTIDERPDLDLAVVALPDVARSAGHRFVGGTFHGVHPIALHGATDRSVLAIVDPAQGRHRVVCRYEGWVQFRSRPIRPRVDLAPLARTLTEQEPGGGRWEATAPSVLTPELATDADGPASELAPEAFVTAVVDHLRTAPAAWDPYRTSD